MRPSSSLIASDEEYPPPRFEIHQRCDVSLTPPLPNAAEQQHIKLFIGDRHEPAAYHKLTTRDGPRESTLNSGNGKKSNGQPFTLNSGILVSEDGHDGDYNDGLAVLDGRSAD
ncbi:fucose-binding lectin II [Burkholderia gladioli]|uniref:fucose-binding lectin II n=1 Tax=Burkholderia gladioli TaxID=28095 RepID=UPI001FC82A00|nr:fucose-binding lectin II [Burkholderia gladioli]